MIFGRAITGPSISLFGYIVQGGYMTQGLLEAENITKTFGQLTAVNTVSLTIKPGECFALLGPNGAGKTTLVEILEGIQEADSGQVRLFGTTYQKQGRAIREQIGVVLQETNLYKRFTVRETLQMFASLYHHSVALDQLIADLGLTEKANTQLLKLSGGQRQRVYLGAALVNDPKMLFLDEPTTGLDPHTRRNTWELIRQLKSQGRGILLTTHYMEEAAYLADRIAIMYAGKIIAAGTTAELIKDYGGAYTFIARWHHAPDQLTAKWHAHALHQTVEMRTTSNSKEVEFILADPVKSVRAILAFLDQEGLAPEHFELRQSTLEDVFIKLTGKNLHHAAEISA